MAARCYLPTNCSNDSSTIRSGYDYTRCQEEQTQQKGLPPAHSGSSATTCKELHGPSEDAILPLQEGSTALLPLQSEALPLHIGCTESQGVATLGVSTESHQPACRTITMNLV